MKRCPRCSIKYSEMWNTCLVCGSALASDTVVSKIFSKNRQGAGYLFPIVEKSLEDADVLFMYLDTDLKLIMCNEAVEHITGYSRREVFRGDWQKLFFGKNSSKKEIFKAVLKSCLSGTRSMAYNGSIMKKDGSERVLSWRNTVMTDASGKAKGIFCIAHDITEYEAVKNDVAASAEKMKDIFASIKDYALITTNLSNKITYYGASTVSLFGWDKDMILKDIGLIFPAGESVKSLSRIKRKITSAGSFEEETALLKLNGDEFPAMLLVSALINAENRESGYVYIVRDITEKKKIEARMIQSEKMAAMGQLAAGVAHEINNPLLVISGRIDMLAMDKSEITPPVKKTIDIISAQAKRMRTIVDRLLSYSRKKRVNMSLLDVNSILKTIAPLVAYYPEFHKVAWREELGEGMPKVKGDFNQLQEVFLNLAINACQAMPDGGSLTIVSSSPDNRFVHVDVKDTGAGIKKEDLGKLFLPFFTTKDNGTGLGLPLCYSIVETHGGIIEVDSEIDKGTVFSVILPVSSAEEADVK